jgi:hypothetical protein
MEDLPDPERVFMIDFSRIHYDQLSSHREVEGFSKCIPDASEEDYYEYLRFLKSNELRHHCFYDNSIRSIVITRMGPPSAQHESTHGIVTCMVSAWNQHLSGRMSYPIRIRGGSPVHVGGRIVSPDAQYCVPNRPCPNMVVESSDNQTLADLIRKLKSYIEDTNNIMFALGFKFLRVWDGVGLLAIGYSREHGVQEPLFIINFGSANFSSQAIGSILQTTQLPNENSFTGLGYGDHECTVQGMPAYCIVVPRQWMLCTDFVGVELFGQGNLQLEDVDNFVIDLFFVRDAFFLNID